MWWGITAHRDGWMELTPLCGERDRGGFAGWARLGSLPGLSGPRSSAPGRWAAL